MCTVTYIKTKDKVLITSNRDESLSRPIAYQPEEALIEGCKVYYPKDAKAGGTWFAINEFGASVILLNGAFEKHKKSGSYVHSRGLVTLETVANADPFKKIQDYNLSGIEPFTLIIYQPEELMEVRWDGMHKYVKKLDSSSAHIWSSVTLYKPAVVLHRERLFSDFFSNVPNAHEDEVIQFQSDDHKDPENGFVINRQNGLRTFSITQAVYGKTSLVIRHFDLLNTASYELPVLAGHNYTADHEPAQA